VNSCHPYYFSFVFRDDDVIQELDDVIQELEEVTDQSDLSKLVACDICRKLLVDVETGAGLLLPTGKPASPPPVRCLGVITPSGMLPIGSCHCGSYCAYSIHSETWITQLQGTTKRSLSYKMFEL